MRMTYWLFWGTEVLTAVRGDAGLSESEIRSLALKSHKRIPLGFPEHTPDEFRSKLCRATIKTYPGGN